MGCFFLIQNIYFQAMIAKDTTMTATKIIYPQPNFLRVFAWIGFCG